MTNTNEAIIAAAASRLDRAVPWTMVSTDLAGRRTGASRLDPNSLRRWVIAETSTWPAPIPFGRCAPHRVGDRLVATGRVDPSERADTCYADFGEDGSAIAALRLGTVDNKRPDDREVWAIGEGAVVWFTLAAARLVAAHGVRTDPNGAATLQIDLIPPDDGRPLQMWNRQDGTHQPSSPTLIASADPARLRVGLTECLSPRLTQAVRPVLDEVFRRFGVHDLRHITNEGAIRASPFTGHADRVSAWARAIGVPYEP